MASSSRRRSRAILRAAWSTLRRDPALLWFSAFIAVATTAVVATSAVLGWLGARAAVLALGVEVSGALETSIDTRATLGMGLFAWFGLHLVAPFFGVAAASATLEALAGRRWTVAGAIGTALERSGSIATFAVLDASVGALLARMRGGRRDRAGKRPRREGHPLVAKLLGAAWWTATYLAVPVIARERRGGVAAVQRSSTIMRDTWKEAFLGRLVLGWVLWPVAILAVLGTVGVCLLLGLSPDTHAASFAIAAGVAVVAIAVVAAVLQTLDTIYRCALYVFATEGVVPEPFDDAQLQEVWHSA